MRRILHNVWRASRHLGRLEEFRLQFISGFIGSECWAEESPSRRKKIEAYTRKLAEITPRDLAPEAWARAQYNLGRLYLIDAADNGRSEVLEKARERHEAALEVLAEGDDARTWAQTLINLGHIYNILGERTGERAHHHAALQVCEQALTHFTFEVSVPEWSAAQINRCSAKLGLATLNYGMAELEEAIRLADNIITYPVRQAVPNHWGGANLLKCNAYLEIAQRDRDHEPLLEARAAIELALSVFDRETSPTEWLSALNNLACCDIELAARTKESSHVDSAIDYLRRVENDWRDVAVRYWSRTRCNIAFAHIVEYDLRADRRSLIAAHNIYLEMWDRLDPVQDPVGHWRAHLGLAECLLRRAEAEGQPGLYKAAVDAATEARRRPGLETTPMQLAETEMLLGECLRAAASQSGDDDMHGRASSALGQALLIYRQTKRDDLVDRIQRNFKNDRWARLHKLSAS